MPHATTEFMAVEEPPEGGPAVAGNDALPLQESVPPGELGARRNETIRRDRRETETELARVRATARLVEEDRIGLAGYIALFLVVPVNLWGFSPSATAIC